MIQIIDKDLSNFFTKQSAKLGNNVVLYQQVDKIKFKTERGI